ncbi:hypothetical protein GOB94_15045 [Granulicella sp. 5B5]|uniref:hypothetical protein n=1 Tax=Granulicella sp. 5B5 TaxID=1617967 RepID=UPI0015F4492A|nr:hypothetical protein [Granulicella sp. 5B5]QMV19852.1 hypothetical protein GOB94_15045 [Granulicella sp. 5B5]
MDVSKILAEIDEQIAALQSARGAILSLHTGAPVKGKRGRPKGSTNAAKPAKKKRNLTPEGRKRIADAMKRRWAAQRKEATKKEAPKKEAVKK